MDLVTLENVDGRAVSAEDKHDSRITPLSGMDKNKLVAPRPSDEDASIPSYLSTSAK
jgi:hypothetical protein